MSRLHALAAWPFGNDASMKVILCMDCAVQGNDWVDCNGTDVKPTFHRRANLSWFSKICNHFREIAAWSRKSLTMITVFLEKDPLRTNFQKKYSEKIHRVTQPRLVSCVQISWNFADRKSAKSCVVYLTKKKLPQGLPLSLLSGPAPNNILRVPKISSKSVHFRRSYSRTREHRWNAPQSISNTRRSFFAE